MTTWFITGISRGFGLELTKAALARGDTVIGTVRDGAPEIGADSGRLHVLKADLAEKDAAERVVREAFGIAGKIDIIVNNAGYGLLGALETSTDEEMERLFAVDVFAPVRIIRAALPHLRQQGSGHIVNITSIAGRAPGPGYALYASVKFALEGLSTALAQELQPLGIKVTAVAPGAFRTDFLSSHSIRWAAPEDSAYAQTVGATSARFATSDGKQPGDPVRAAQAIIKAVTAPEPPVHLLLGSDAVRRAREKLDAVIEEMDAWDEVSRGTDFREG
ncbi:short-chain dehydrogenase/reductase [Brucella endophytica]|uniref:Short-chain dehydrogenase/reductase n=1 Tax=Brucella endophytica TaxID=1963359 RepID=A0A916SJ67_9HYPH|nr:oxidoreductase [Brucella endophytica]GGB02830.1 short-chain dehydrogenase/reductase [Brucella endophytica]